MYQDIPADLTEQSPAATAIVSSTDPTWRPILHVSNQVVLYNPTSHALSIYPSTFKEDPHTPSLKHSRLRLCPYCSQPLPKDQADDDEESDYDLDRFEDVSPEARAANYFQLLAVANESASRPTTPPIKAASSTSSSRASSPPPSPGPEDEHAFRPESMADGYFKAFFREEARLGMGANGSVYLCQHVLNGNPLGHFAVKKIAVGQSSSYLLQILREVRLLETLRHPNIITYHHAWLENARFSSFGPKIPTLHVLMQWAEGGSLDDYIDARLGRATHVPHPASHHDAGASSSVDPTSTTDTDVPDMPPQSRSARIRAFRALQRAPAAQKSALRAKFGFDSGPAGNGSAWKAVHLLSAEEVKGVFGGVVAGLGFLHDKSILHLDLKPGNVLLTWDEGSLIPRAMLSDFGTSRDMLHSSGARSGNTGTLEYTSPESLPKPPSHTLPPTDSKSDMWSLGMILHKLLFFRLPYRWAAHGDRAAEDEANEASGGDTDMDKLEREVLSYPGFKATPGLDTVFTSRRLPRAYIVLLESLLHITPSVRPSCEKVLAAVQLGKLDPLPTPSNRLNVHIPTTSISPVSSLIPLPRRARSSSPSASSTESDHTVHRQPTPPSNFLSRYSPPIAQPRPDDHDLTPKSEAMEPRWVKYNDSAGLPRRAPQGSLWVEIWQDPDGKRTSRIIRAIKSGILAMKVAHITTSRPPPGPWTIFVLLMLGVYDTLSDSLLAAVFYALAHIAVFRACSVWGISV